MEYNIELEVYFEVKDSTVYGGLGSIGYASTKINVCQINYEKESIFNKKELMEEYIENQRKGMAEFCKASVECVKVISKEEYDSNTDWADEANQYFRKAEEEKC